MEGRKAKEYGGGTGGRRRRREEIQEGRKDGEKKRTRGESEMAERTRGNRLGEKLVWSKQQSTDRIDGTYTLLSAMVKSVMEEKEVKEGEKYRHCSSSMTILSVTKMTHLPCTNQPS